MMHHYYDPDEWEVIYQGTPCTFCGGNMRKCNGACNGSASWQMKRRPQDEVEKIRSAKRREYEEMVLQEAEQIKTSRKHLNAK